jgi:hypothetical protein
MVDQAIAAELEFSTRPIHENKEICEYLVSSVKGNFSLQILPSTISNAGSGLFAAEDIAAGQEIFRSTPVVQCPSYYQDMTVCDYCYSSAEGYGKRAKARHENGAFDPLEHACAGCKLKNYCSLVGVQKSYILTTAFQGLIKDFRNVNAKLGQSIIRKSAILLPR